MKRSVIAGTGLLFASAFLVPTVASAQMMVGVGGGLSAAKWVGDGVDELAGTGVDKSTRKGFDVGGFVAVPVGSRFSVVPGVSYTQKGSVFSESSTDLTAKVDYFEVPVLATILLTSRDAGVGFNINVGPMFSFEVGCELEASEGDVSAAVDCDAEGLDERQSFDIGIVTGASLLFPLSPSLRLIVSGGANWGLRTLDTSADPADIKNQAYYINAYVGFPVGG